MCFPALLAAIPAMGGLSTAIGVVGTGISAVSAIQAGNAQADAAAANAKIAGYQSQQSLEAGAKAEEKHRSAVGRMKGAQTAAFAKQGIMVGSGSALDARAETAALGNIDALEIRDNAAREAWGYRVQQANYRAESANAKTASLLSAAGKVAGGWYDLTN